MVYREFQNELSNLVGYPFLDNDPRQVQINKIRDKMLFKMIRRLENKNQVREFVKHVTWQVEGIIEDMLKRNNLTSNQKQIVRAFLVRAKKLTNRWSVY